VDFGILNEIHAWNPTWFVTPTQDGTPTWDKILAWKGKPMRDVMYTRDKIHAWNGNPTWDKIHAQIWSNVTHDLIVEL
jgi:hypothetical protein